VDEKSLERITARRLTVISDVSHQWQYFSANHNKFCTMHIKHLKHGHDATRRISYRFICSPISSTIGWRRFAQDKPMSFSFVDGQIESVCPRTDDETWAVNIRRGILSTLQNTMRSLKGVATAREVDVSGDCPVVYEVSRCIFFILIQYCPLCI